MRAPAFWNGNAPGPLASLLAPVGKLYGAIAAARLGRPGLRAGVPVLCIGNFTAGGAGKTPAALAIADLLVNAGETPAFLSRGYGGRHRGGPLRVDPGLHSADIAGDEPLLLARHFPTFVTPDRPAAAAAAVAQGASVLVMDDGLQNPALVKDIGLAVVDGESGIGNGLCLPAGPLRMPMSKQWPLVSALIVIGSGAAGDRLAEEARGRGLPVFRAALVPEADSAAGIAGRKTIAFAGIGRPEKFFATLRALGAEIVETHAFGDHAPYRLAELVALAASARGQGALLVTTEKDLARIGQAHWTALDCERAVLPVALRFEDARSVEAFLAKQMAAARARI